MILGLLKTGLLAILGAGTPFSASRVFPFPQAEQARKLARRECKPLVVHFVPETELGREQVKSFYSGPNCISNSVLEQVVVVVVPTEKFAAFARDLGLSTPGGFRTLSGYDLAPFDEKAAATCKTGFR